MRTRRLHLRLNVIVKPFSSRVISTSTNVSSHLIFRCAHRALSWQHTCRHGSRRGRRRSQAGGAMQQRTFDGEGHRECEQPLPSALGSVISGLGGSNEAELAIVPGGVFPTTSGGTTFRIEKD